MLPRFRDAGWPTGPACRLIKTGLCFFSLGLLMMTSRAQAAEPSAAVLVPEVSTAGPAAQKAFLERDLNGDGEVSVAELLRGSAPDDELVIRRDFRLADSDRNERLTLDEFRVLAALVPEAERGPLPDPLARLVDERLQQTRAAWNTADRNGDGLLSQTEFLAAELQEHPRLRPAGESAWPLLDRDRDGRIGRDDWRRHLEISYGVRRPQGDRIRSAAGVSTDWAEFKLCDRNGDDRIELLELVARVPDSETAETEFRELDIDANMAISFDEWGRIPSRRHDLFHQFREADNDHNARLSADELVQSVPATLRHFVRYVVPAFDADRDGGLSLDEFALTPVFNPLTDWQVAREDQNADGRLSLDEFLFEPGPALQALFAEYFQRLDLNESGFLETSEWDVEKQSAGRGTSAD